MHGILWKIRLPPPFVVICKRFFESRAHAFDLNPSVSLCMLSVEAQAQLTPLTPLTPLTAWLKGGGGEGDAWSAHLPLRTEFEIDTHSTYSTTHSTHRCVNDTESNGSEKHIAINISYSGANGLFC